MSLEATFLQSSSSVLFAIVVGYFISMIVLMLRNRVKKVSFAKDMPCDEPHWLFGHLLKIKPDERSFYRYLDLLKKFPNYQPVWLGPFTVYIQGYSPDILRTVLSTDEPKDDVGYRFIRPWIGDGLLTSSGAKWKRHRRLLTPAFHFEILQKYLNCMNSGTTELLNKWSVNCQNTSDLLEVELFHDVGQMTLDIILRCILSKESGCQRDDKNEYLQAVKCLTEAVMTRLLFPFYYFDFVFYCTPTGRRYKKAIKVAQDYTESAINERRGEFDKSCPKDIKEMDFLDILLQAKDDRGIGLSHQEICDEVNTFVFEGHDTVSSAICWAMYNLAVHQEIQDKCRDEINNVLGNRLNIEWEDLFKFKYLTMVIKESLRLHPPVFSVGRRLNKPLYFQRSFGKDLLTASYQASLDSTHNTSKVFPKDTNFGIGIMLLHRNPRVWENPSIFDPERFSSENISKRPPHAYLPFSAGPRNCIGQRLAMNEMKVVLARILSTFRLLPDETQPSPEFELNIILRSKNGIHMKLQRLHNACS